MGAVVPWAVPIPVDDVGPGCEPVAGGFLREPFSAWSSLAFVIAGIVIVVLARRRRLALADRVPGADGASGADGGPVAEPSVLAFALLVAGIGVGSVVQHGPDPPWADLAHDIPLLATVAFIAADAVADLAGRARAWWGWVLPTVALTPVIQWLPDVGDRTMGAVAVAAVLTNTYRALRRPALRRPVGATIVLLAAGGIVQVLASPGWPLCDPRSSWWYGHAVWHVLVAAGLAALAPALGWRPVVASGAGVGAGAAVTR